MSLLFEKYTIMGKDYLIYDTLKNEHILTPQDVRWICNRNFGVCLDGILVGTFMEQNRNSLQIYHPDGSQAEEDRDCIMVFAKYVEDAGYIGREEMNLSGLVSRISKILILNEEAMTA